MIVILDNDKGRVEVETCFIKASLDHNQLLCYTIPPDDYYVFDLRQYRFLEIRN